MNIYLFTFMFSNLGRLLNKPVSSFDFKKTQVSDSGFFGFYTTFENLNHPQCYMWSAWSLNQVEGMQSII